MKMRLVVRLLITITVVQFYACANMVSPTGGAKDVIAPKTTKMLPSNYSTNFKGPDIAITFDEFVELKDLENQLLISPPMTLAPDLKIKGKTVYIHLNEPLKENTTYAINFGNAVSDITESNVAENLQYIFSTGSLIDSLYVAGKLLNAKTLAPEKNVLVMLYENSSDSIPYKERPYYFTKTKENGTYKITNLKKGSYKLFALKDGNSNYLYDQPTETIAFSDSLVNTLKTDSINLRLFEDSNTKQRLLKASAEGYGKINFIFGKPFNPLSASILNSNQKKEWGITEYSKNRDTLTYWYTQPASDSMHFILRDAKGPTDTVHLELVSKGKKGRNKFALDLYTNGNTNTFELNRDFNITVNHPVKSHDYKKILLYEDSLLKTDFEVVLQDSSKRFFKIKYPWKESKQYKVLIPKGTFLDIFDLTNDSVVAPFKTRSLDEYGNMVIKLKVPFSSYSYIVQLMDEKENILRENLIKGDEALKYDFLIPQKYKLKIIFDANQNDRWDSGNYLMKVQPEKIIYYTETITVRANWDMEIDWKIKP